jgi:hypothetical protein
VSYNGKSFDTQILKTRFIMNGRHVQFPRQLDLLHPCRKLWSSMLASCTLGSVEEGILNVTRDLDIPGSMVPELFFDYLKSGDVDLMHPVFSHHLQDIVTLERLLRHMNDLLLDPRDAAADRYQLGRWLLETGFPRGVEILADALDLGDRRAGYLLGTHFKRIGDLVRAEELWRGMFDRWLDGYAALELAKHHEHRLRDYVQAEEYVTHLIRATEIEDVVPRIETYERLIHRLERIKRKGGRNGGSAKD